MEKKELEEWRKILAKSLYELEDFLKENRVYEGEKKDIRMISSYIPNWDKIPPYIRDKLSENIGKTKWCMYEIPNPLEKVLKKIIFPHLFIT